MNLVYGKIKMMLSKR